MKLLCAITFCILLTGCSIFRKPVDYKAYTIDKEGLKSISSKIIFTTDLDKGRHPVNNLTEIEIKNTELVYAYVTWFNLDIRKEYYAKVQWFDPANNIFEQNDHAFKPGTPTNYTWFPLMVNANVTPRGKFKVRVFLNNEFIRDTTIVLR